ncbi:MAG TPA: AMP-binding protein [Rectinemataceae bacterium]|nr:AMP-binding protein [Rectinemataceae bacterium]
MKRTVLRMLSDAVATFPDDPYALRKTDAGYAANSYRQVAEKARQAAAWFVARGFAKGDRAAILAEGCPEWIIGELGLVAAGCVSVPLSIKLLEEEIPFRVEHSGSRAILTTKNQLEKVFGALGRIERRDILAICLDEDPDSTLAIAAKVGFEASRVFSFATLLAEGAALLADGSSGIAAQVKAREESAEEDDTVTLSYTSGTTGNPKGIQLTHLNYWTNCHDAIEVFKIPRGWRTLLVLPIDHSFAHTCGLYASLLISWQLWFVDSRGGGIATLRNIPINLLEARPHILLTVPALSGNFMKKIIQGIEEKGGFVEKIFKRGIEAGIARNGDGFRKPPLGVRLANLLPWWLAKTLVFATVKKKVFGDSIRYCVGGGALLDVKQQEFFAALGMPIYQGYGLTEAAPVICTNSPDRHKFGSSGFVFPSVECDIRDAGGKPLPVGEVGEIVVRGDSVMKGYFGNPEATRAALVDGWLHTGDRGRMDADGFLTVVGREKALLVGADGEKYSPEEIEEAVTFSTDLIDQIMAWCDEQKYVSVFLTLDEARVKRTIADRGIATAEALLSVLKDEFFRFKTDPKGRKIPPAWIPAGFHIMPEIWSDRDGTVNSTMKIVRHRIVEVYRDRIDYACGPEGSRTENPRNLEVLRKIFSLP